MVSFFFARFRRKERDIETDIARLTPIVDAIQSALRDLETAATTLDVPFDVTCEIGHSLTDRDLVPRNRQVKREVESLRLALRLLDDARGRA